MRLGHCLVDVLAGEVEVPRRMPALDDRQEAAVEPAAVGDRPVLAVRPRDLGDLPAEERAVEGGGGLDVGRDQVVPGQGADGVDQSRPDALLRLPDRDHGPLRIGEGRHAPCVEDVEGRRQDVGAELGSPGRARVDVRHGDVAVPVRRDALVLALAETGDAVALHLGHRVHGALADRDVVVAPTEERAIELLGAVDVVGLQVDPAEGSGCVARAFAHAATLPRAR